MTSMLEINGWNAGIKFSAAHLLFGHDKCGVLHGHTYALHLKIYGEKNSKGFLLDFGEIKSLLNTIAESLDHRILIPNQSKAVQIKNQTVHVSYDQKQYQFPREDCVLLPLPQTTVEHLIDYILEQVLQKLQPTNNITAIEVGLDEGIGQGVWKHHAL